MVEFYLLQDFSFFLSDSILFLFGIEQNRTFNVIYDILIGLYTNSSDNRICLQESFNTNISHQLFDYTITFVNSQH